MEQISIKSISRSAKPIFRLLDFQGVNRLFLLSFEYTTDRTVNTKYCLPTVTVKDYNVIIDEPNFLDEPVKYNLITYDNIWKIVTGYTARCLLDYNYFNNYYKMIVIELSKQQALDADPKAIQQINFTGNLAQDPVANTTLFITEETKKKNLDFSQGTALY